MHDVPESVERLICRHLDGEISGDEQRALDRALICSPAAQRMLAEYAAVDALTATVLRESAARRGEPVALPQPGTMPRLGTMPGRVRRRQRWMIPAAALAACLAAFILWHTPPVGDPANAGRQADHGGAGHGSPVAHDVRPIPQVGSPGSDVGVWRVADQPAPELDRVTNRNVIFLSDDEGNIYMINVDHVRELQKPKSRSGLQFTGDPI